MNEYREPVRVFYEMGKYQNCDIYYIVRESVYKRHTDKCIVFESSIQKACEAMQHLLRMHDMHTSEYELRRFPVSQ